MVDPLKDHEVDKAFYSLAEVERDFYLTTDTILDRAKHGNITLCVHVPVGHRAYCVDPNSIQTSDLIARANKWQSARRKRPALSEKRGPPQPMEDIEFLTVHKDLCHAVKDTGQAAQELFNEGYMTTGGLLGPKGVDDVLPVRPQVMPLVDGSGEFTNQSGSRFAVYVREQLFEFSDATGYPPPIPLKLSRENLYVAGIELQRYKLWEDLTSDTYVPDEEWATHKNKSEKLIHLYRVAIKAWLMQQDTKKYPTPNVVEKWLCAFQSEDYPKHQISLNVAEAGAGIIRVNAPAVGPAPKLPPRTAMFEALVHIWEACWKNADMDKRDTFTYSTEGIEAKIRSHPAFKGHLAWGKAGATLIRPSNARPGRPEAR